MAIFKKQITQAGLFAAAYLGHSFRKDVAQYAAHHGMLDKSIQRLGTWTSNAIRFYFTTLLKALFNFNLSFQKGMPLAVAKATTPSTKPYQLPKAQEEDTRTSQLPYPLIYLIQPYIPTTNTNTPFWAIFFRR